jgi:hypothetical protein
MDALDSLLHRFAVLDPDGLALRGDLLLRAWGWTGPVDRLSFVLLDGRPFLPRLRAVMADRDLDELRWTRIDPVGRGFRLDGTVPVLVEAIVEPCVPAADFVEVPGGTPILGWRPETAAAWLEGQGRTADLAWLRHWRDLDDELLEAARRARPG